MQYDFLYGTGVALITPFTSSGKIDSKALEGVVEHVIQGGVDYLVPLGTTGESPTLTAQDKAEVMRTVIAVNAGRKPVVMGLGGNSTQEQVEAIKILDFKGIDAILSVSPYYNRPSQEGIFQHYAAMAQVLPVPMILYNIPGRTGSKMEAKTCLRLANAHPNIVGIKEASGSMLQMMDIIQGKPEAFHVISGDDSLALACVACGGSGVISVLANLVPYEISSMLRACLQGDFATARTQHYQVQQLFRLLFVDGNPAGIKAMMSSKGFCENVLRLPLTTVSDTTLELIQVAIGGLARRD